MSLELLYAKDAIFKMIMQFHHVSDIFNNGELYIQNYCESALEAAFNTLGIEENYIPLHDFCQMWEDNDRAIWTINSPYEPFHGISADIHYKIFKDEYDMRQRWLENVDIVTLVHPESGDWEALYVDGKLAAESHSISAEQALKCIENPFDYKLECIEISDEVAEMGMPALLFDLEVQV